MRAPVGANNAILPCPVLKQSGIFLFGQSLPWNNLDFLNLVGHCCLETFIHGKVRWNVLFCAQTTFNPINSSWKRGVKLALTLVLALALALALNIALALVLALSLYICLAWSSFLRPAAETNWAVQSNWQKMQEEREEENTLKKIQLSRNSMENV